MTTGVSAAVSALLAAAWVMLAAHAQAKSEIDLRILATTDIHTYILDYDYYRDEPTSEYGLVRAASLIEAARREAANTLLFDNGDLLQGNPLGDYTARRAGLQGGDAHPAFKVMNRMGYDAAVVGNHEFNFGLDFLETALKGADFPYTVANVLRVGADGNVTEPFLPPTLLLERTVKDRQGRAHAITVGVIGLVTPQIMVWDRDKLSGRLTTRDILESARRFVPQMKAAGADIIIVLAHSGIGDERREPLQENAVWHLSTIEGIDAIVAGHSHRVFPGETYAGLKGADLARGTINGKPVVMAGAWGSHIGIIDLTLRSDEGRIEVTSAKAETRAIHARRDGREVSLAPRSDVLAAAVATEHAATIAMVREPVAAASERISTYMTLLGDMRALSLVQAAQRRYAEKAVAGTQWEGLPILSAASPFKSGGRMGPEYYTDIPAGPVSVRNIADLYIYPNTVMIIKVTGRELREWLEKSALVFNRIDPQATVPQPLIAGVPSYNFDVIDRLTYAIDVTQPARYDRDGALIDPAARRIRDLRFEGRPIREDESFLVVSNSYRANGGGGFPGLDGSRTVIETADPTQQMIVEDLRARGIVDPDPTPVWRFAPVSGNPIVTVDIGAAGSDVALADPRLRKREDLETGFTRFQIDLR
jgi:2',3'-cyclic-nucleotide 2'-phosphodiesterase/3'-nucleotidase